MKSLHALTVLTYHSLLLTAAECDAFATDDNLVPLGESGDVVLESTGPDDSGIPRGVEVREAGDVAAKRLVRQPGDLVAEGNAVGTAGNGPLGNRRLAQDRLEQGRLSGGNGSDDGGQLALRDIQRHIRQRWLRIRLPAELGLSNLNAVPRSRHQDHRGLLLRFRGD